MGRWFAVLLLALAPNVVNGCAGRSRSLDAAAGDSQLPGDGAKGHGADGGSGPGVGLGGAGRGGGAGGHRSGSGGSGAHGGDSAPGGFGGEAGEMISDGGVATSGTGGDAGEGGLANGPIRPLCRSSLDPGPCESPLLDLGSDHGCTLDPGGRIWCWGMNGWADAGDEVYGMSAPPAGVFKRLAVGVAGCALGADGVATCWGGQWEAWQAEKNPPTTPFIEISIEDSGGCGLTLEGKVECFGSTRFWDGWEQPDFESEFAALSYTSRLLCALAAEGTVTCWGKQGESALEPPAGPFHAVSAGLLHACGVTTKGAVECWGNDDDGKTTPPSGQFVQVSAGVRHTCALRTDGTLVCWGDPKLTNAPLGTFVEVKAGSSFSCARRTDGKIACWGDDSYLALQVPAPFALEDQRYVDLDVGGEYWIEDYDGWDSVGGLPSVCGIHLDGTLACWGDLQGLSLPDGAFTQVSVGAGTACALREDGALACFGLHDDERGDRPELAPPPDGEFTQVSLGYGHACALRTDGTLACWEAPPGTDITSAGPPPAGAFIQVAVSDAAEPYYSWRGGTVARSACALRADGDAVCWDANGEQERPGPFVEINVACGLHADGTVSCWGTPVPYSTGMPVGTFRQISGGYLLPSDGFHSENSPRDPLVTFGWAHDFGCGLTAEGQVRCRGSVIR